MICMTQNNTETERRVKIRDRNRKYIIFLSIIPNPSPAVVSRLCVGVMFAHRFPMIQYQSRASRRSVDQ